MVPRREKTFAFSGLPLLLEKKKARVGGSGQGKMPRGKIAEIYVECG